MPPLTLLRYLKPCSRRKLQRLHRTHAALAVDVNLLVRIEFGEALRRACSAGISGTPFDVRDLVFVRLAHVDDLDAELRIVERLLHFLHGDFVRIALRSRPVRA